MTSNLNPGGYIELADICFPVETIDDSLPVDSALRDWSDLMLMASQQAGIPINSAALYKSQLEAAGFKNIVELRFKWPQGRWPKDSKYEELGKSSPLFL